jgi:hypothetical protein
LCPVFLITIVKENELFISVIVTFDLIPYHIDMNWKNKNIKTFLTGLVLAFIVVSNLAVFVDFGHAGGSNCCGAECQCFVEKECGMTIDCSSTHVVILIPILNIYENENIEARSVHQDYYLDKINFSQSINSKFTSNHKPILKPPFSKINTPLLI